MMKSKISLIIPVFNVEAYLRKAIDSVISQTFGIENIEVILIDDCSTDSSADIIKEYVDKYDNIKGFYLDECSGYAGKPRNVGLENATSEFIMFLDSDDIMQNNACEILYNTIIKEDCDIVSGSFTSLNKDGEVKLNLWNWALTLTSPDLNKNLRKKKAKELLSSPDFKVVVTNLDENPTILGNSNVWGKIYKKSLIDDNNIRFPEDIVAQDSVFLLNTLYHAKKVVFIKDIIVHYNSNRNYGKNRSISHVKSKDNLEARIKAYDLMYNLSVKHSREEIFFKYLLCGKINYWYNKYLLKTPISTSEIKDIFTKYSHLLNKCIIINKEDYPKSTLEVFNEIRNENYSKAAQIAKKAQLEKSKTKEKKPIKFSKNNLKEYLKIIIKKFIK